MRAADVFTPGSLPDITYVGDHLVERAQILHDTIDAGSQAITLSGPSKSGKTVFVEKNFGMSRLVVVTGANISSADDLWEKVFAVAKIPVGKKVTRTAGGQGGGGVKASASIPGLAKIEGSGNGTYSKSTAVQTEDSIDYLDLAIKSFSGSGKIIFIDDFHYIPREIQANISNQIKEAIRQNVLFIIASVPYHSDDAVRANSDLRGRAVNIDFNYWDKEELLKIAIVGYEALNVAMPLGYIESLANEAAGSPQLMQSLCLNTCYELGIREKQATALSPNVPPTLLDKVCKRTAATADYSSTFDKMAEGPKTRGQERKGYYLKSGEVCDVYPLILKALAMPPPLLTIRYPTLQQRIADLCHKDTPSGSSVTGACEHMSSIANDSEGRTIIEWDSDNDVFDIRDPYLLFYIRWGKKK